MDYNIQQLFQDVGKVENCRFHPQRDLTVFPTDRLADLTPSPPTELATTVFHTIEQHLGIRNSQARHQFWQGTQVEFVSGVYTYEDMQALATEGITLMELNAPYLLAPAVEMGRVYTRSEITQAGAPAFLLGLGHLLHALGTTYGYRLPIHDITGWLNPIRRFMENPTDGQEWPMDTLVQLTDQVTIAVGGFSVSSFEQRGAWENLQRNPAQAALMLARHAVTMSGGGLPHVCARMDKISQADAFRRCSILSLRDTIRHGLEGARAFSIKLVAGNMGFGTTNEHADMRGYRIGYTDTPA